MKVVKKEPSKHQEKPVVPKPKPEALELPEWIDPTIWREFKAMRVRIKKPMTPYAEKRMLAKLGKLRAAGAVPNDLLHRSIDKCWQDVYDVYVAGGRPLPRGKDFNLD